jgi:transcriptional regulator CtsR
MANNLSDLIEQFILTALQDEDSLDIGRNELASHFSVAPSQINYVLSTRFTPDRGYVVESRRGGGGYVRVERMNSEYLDYIEDLLSGNTALSMKGALHIIEKLEHNKMLTAESGCVLKTALSDKALKNPMNLEAYLRASILKEVVTRLILERQSKEKEGEV